ncbi:VanZ family protein [Streptomyces sp. MUM 203J]|uniref:VanZ family protein n=1 Tax=Streptomyces sp. MUM 203J TaxID=2791990 RepID=UPI001F03C789|nr:VanZ family protein [Streptomyces sp. MUM 203J]
MQRQGSGGSAVIRYRVAGLVLLFLHLLTVGWLTLRPLDLTWVNAANLEPLAGIRATLALGPAEAAWRLAGGLLLLAPLGALLPMADARLDVAVWASLARTVSGGALVSLGIELLQTAVPGRVVDVDDVLLNTLGVALAHLLLVPACRARLRRRLHGPYGARGAGRGGRPSAGRRGAGVAGRAPSVSASARSGWGSGSAAGPTGAAWTRRGGALLREEGPQGPTPTIPRVGIAP